MIKTELLQSQKETVAFLRSKKIIGDWSKMGTGKTLSALASIDSIGIPALIVCPPFLVANWQAEVAKHTDLKSSPHFLKPDLTADIHIVPYTQLSKAEALFKLCKFIVCDESQYLKNLDAQRTKAFHTMFYKYPPEYFMSLSGTPMKNRIPELYGLLLLWASAGVKPAITDKYKSYYSFCCRFTNVVQGKYGMSYGGSKNVEELRTYLKPNSIKHEASLSVSLQETSVVVSYKEDKELEKAFSSFTGSRFSAEITIKVQSAVSKAIFTSRYIDDAIEAEEGPVVVFSDHRKPLDTMELELSHLRVRQITGDVNMSKRQEYVDMLNKGQLDVLLCTYGAASTGINLHGSNLMVLNDLPWTVAELEQAKKRSHRMGQTKNCRIIHIIGSSVDTLILNTLNAKLKNISKVMA